MRIFAAALMMTGLAIGITTTAPKASAQVSVRIGPAPDCPYGYYDISPYTCAPYGYYGPEWFNGGVFIGAGPWFHGPERFHGYVDNHFDRDHYHGDFPHRGDRRDEHHREDRSHFHGNEMHDGHGHVTRHK